jgi:hypothetical protein
MRYVLLLAAVLTCSSCDSIMGWMMRPYPFAAGKMARGPREIPPEDLTFMVSRRPGKIRVTISSASWQIQGCGAGNDGAGDLILHSVGGVRTAGGSHFPVDFVTAPDSRPRIFLLSSLSGRREIR